MDVAANMNTGRRRIHPQKFALMLACASITMMFAALTSADIVRQASGNWLEFNLPNLFFISTLTIIASSATLYLSEKSFKAHKERPYKLFLVVTFILGILFIAFQYMAWLKLDAAGVVFNGNPSGSFIYVISGLHAAHVLGGIVVLFVALVQSMALPFYISKQRLKRLSLTSFYWHFMGILWLYLFVFLILQN